MTLPRHPVTLPRRCYGWPWVAVATHGSPWQTHGLPRRSMARHDVATVTHGLPWVCITIGMTHGNPWPCDTPCRCHATRGAAPTPHDVTTTLRRFAMTSPRQPMGRHGTIMKPYDVATAGRGLPWLAMPMPRQPTALLGTPWCRQGKPWCRQGNP